MRCVSRESRPFASARTARRYGWSVAAPGFSAGTAMFGWYQPPRQLGELGFARRMRTSRLESATCCQREFLKTSATSFPPHIPLFPGVINTAAADPERFAGLQYP